MAKVVGRGIRKNRGNLDSATLISGINSRMENEKLSIRSVAKQVGVSKECMYRLLSGRGGTDIDKISKICDWLNIPIWVVMKDSHEMRQISMGKDTMMSISRVIKGDKTLTDFGKESLIELMSCAYTRFVQHDEKTKA